MGSDFGSTPATRASKDGRDYFREAGIEVYHNDGLGADPLFRRVVVKRDDIERVVEYVGRLMVYAEHRAHCAKGAGPGRDCDCGLDDIRAAVVSARRLDNSERGATPTLLRPEVTEPRRDVDGVRLLRVVMDDDVFLADVAHAIQAHSLTMDELYIGVRDQRAAKGGTPPKPKGDGESVQCGCGRWHSGMTINDTPTTHCEVCDPIIQKTRTKPNQTAGENEWERIISHTQRLTDAVDRVADSLEEWAAECGDHSGMMDCVGELRALLEKGKTLTTGRDMHSNSQASDK